MDFVFSLNAPRMLIIVQNLFPYDLFGHLQRIIFVKDIFLKENICQNMSSVSSFKSSLKTFLFSKTFLQSPCSEVLVCVKVCVSVSVSVSVSVNVCVRECGCLCLLFVYLNF